MKRNHDAVARLVADHSSDVAVASGIFREHDVARPEASHRTIAGLDLNLAGERNNILAPGRRVIVAVMGRRHPTKEYSVHRLELRYFHVSTQVELNLDVFEMGFVIRSGI